MYSLKMMFQYKVLKFLPIKKYSDNLHSEV